MRYIVTLFWGIILGQVAGFLIGALSGASYDPATSAIVSVVFVLILFTLPAIMNHYTPKPAQAKSDDQ
ncbi:YjzD family protein [Lacticaseibacillus nasuensis]|uniref:YjzD family protein n=1 Tax=Lacticaseibacillus nasuensis TaxID=944671 RepID=UPI0006CF6419|nr:YjzD family protein [Lacticaseibacillus nasuensis]